MNKTFPSITIAAVIGIIFLNTFTANAILITNAAPNFPAEWQLTIMGSVEHPINLTLYDLAAMPQTTVAATILCVDFPTVVVATGDWKGVKLSTLLEQAGVLPSAMKVAFYAQDGYTSDLDLQTATSENVIVAYERDGSLLSETLRLVVPGRWGYKWVSQLTQIALLDYDFKGKWESQGYSDEATVQTSTTRPPPSTTPTFPNPNQPSQPTTASSNTSAPDASITQPPQETQNSNPEPQLQSPDSELVFFLASAASVAIVASCLAVYMKKRHDRKLVSPTARSTILQESEAPT